MHVPPAQFGLRHKPIPLDAKILLCISYHYSVTLTNKHDTTDLIYRSFIQICYMFLLSTSAINRVASIYKMNKKEERPFLTKCGNKIFENFDNHYSLKKCNKIKDCIDNVPGTIQCIGSNTKLECKIKQNKTKQN